MSILELFCSVDDFWQQFAPNWHHDLLTSGQRQRLRPTQMYPSEIMTIVILFHQSHYRTFKALLHQARPMSSEQRVSHLSELLTLRRADAHRLGSAGGLPAYAIGPV